MTTPDSSLRPEEPRKPFRTLSELVGAAVRHFQYRLRSQELTGRKGTAGGRSHADRVEDSRYKLYLRVRDSFRHLAFCWNCFTHNLDPLEVEILLAMSLSQMGVLEMEFSTPQELADALAYTPDERYSLLIKLEEHAPLCRHGFLHRVEASLVGTQLKDTQFRVAAHCLGMLLQEKTEETHSTQVKTDRGHTHLLHRYLRKARQRAELVNQILDGDIDASVMEQGTEIFLDTHRRMKAMLQEHPDWGLTRLIQQADGREEEEIVLLILAGKALGVLRANHPFFTSDYITYAARLSKDNLAGELETIGTYGRLQAAGLIEETDEGWMIKAMCLLDTPEGKPLALTSKAREILGIGPKTESYATAALRTMRPCLTLEELVLTDAVRERLNLAISQARHSSTLLHSWGLKRRFSYGVGTTVLLSGPPGVGKTACAHALAESLGQELMVVDYTRVIGRRVGGLEYDVVRTFRQANERRAVLFWDNADTMLSARETDMRRWESAQLNVLLQQIEKCEGVCIFATNRKPSLDPVLEKRIKWKIELERPNRDARYRLWNTLLPDELPIADDVRLDDLAEHDLSGGEIKNVILTAATLALVRSAKGPLAMADFDQALKMDFEGPLDRET